MRFSLGRPPRWMTRPPATLLAALTLLAMSAWAGQRLPQAADDEGSTMPARKSFLLRVDPAVLQAMQRWADDDLRSVNAQIEFVLRRTLAQQGRLKAGPEQPAAEDEEQPAARDAG